MLLSSGPGHAQAPCEPPAARVVSIQGTVELRRAGTDVWTPAMLEEGLCIGDALRVGQASRAALALANDATLRLDQRTTLQLRGVAEEERSLLELLFGAVYFFSHRPRALEVDTPFVNAAAEGTEFLVRVGDDRAEVVMLDGQVLLQNPHGELRVASGDAALVPEGEAPAPMIVARPRDAVAWALYYPPVLTDLAGRAPPRPLPSGLQTALERVAENDYAGALQALEAAPEPARDARYHTYLAGMLLNVGRVEEAEDAVERALVLDPEAGEALAQRAIIHVVQNRKEDALADARRAVELSPESSAARIALSYALQANFQLEEARAVLREAVERSPDDALAWARLAELELMFGALGAARDAAERAVALAPRLSRTQMVLGFAALTRIDINGAKAAFERAIALDSANPLPRLGLGLAKIRRSDLAAGRQEIEIAAALDPNDSLLRSYLGKAYFEEKRGPLDAEQFAIAKQLDPNDPTPWFYDAIRLQTENRPVEALRNIQRSIELNDNRAVYRSRLLLDEDLAARQVSQARIYNNLRFEQLGLNEASKSLALDPANFSAHRFLSDTYAELPRHEIARASELLQAQLLQPININPTQARLQVFDLNVTAGAGPNVLGINEFNQLFERNQAQLTATAVGGNNATFANEILASAVWNKFSFAGSQFHSQTDGFRENNDLNNDIYNAFGQWSLSPNVGLQFDYRHRDTDQGDLALEFDPDSFAADLRNDLRQDTYRIGGVYQQPQFGSLILSAIYTDFTDKTKQPSLFGLEIDDHQEGYEFEGRHSISRDPLTLTTGAGYYRLDQDLVGSTEFSSAKGPPKIEQLNLYTYAGIRYPEAANWTLGLSWDDFEQPPFEERQINPKLGLLWEVTPSLLLRIAGMRTVARARALNQTVEPTTLAGFNQFYDDFPGTKAWQYSGGIDAEITNALYVGFQYTFRDLDGPVFLLEPSGNEVMKAEGDENAGRIYAYWIPAERWALRLGVEYERFKQTPKDPGPILKRKVETWLVPISGAYFHPSGWFAELTSSWVSQQVDNEEGVNLAEGDDAFVVVDAAVGYRFPKRYGGISIGVANLLDNSFKYQDFNFRTGETISARFLPERTILGRLTLTF